MLGIVVITYNIPVEVLLTQIEAIKRFSLDPCEIVIVDNSDKQEYIDQVSYHVSLDPDIRYFKTQASSSGGSDSHSFAANLSYSFIKDDYEYLFYLDHDCLPAKEFSVKEILGDKLMGGIGQHKKVVYFWPGCFMFNNSLIDHSLVDFSPNNKLGTDTGGNLYQLLDKYGSDQVYFDERYVQNPEFTGPQYNYYAMIYNSTFFHMVNGSGWNKISNNLDRINSLLNQYKELTSV